MRFGRGLKGYSLIDKYPNLEFNYENAVQNICENTMSSQVIILWYFK